MRTAETIVREYLEDGFSLQSLRVLAESRPEPTCSEMLAIISRLEREAPEVACETDVSVEEVGYGDMVFFVADDDESVSGEQPIDFDIMAETASDVVLEEPVAALDESIAEICIGETEGSDVVALDAPAAPENAALDATAEDSSAWTSCWSRHASDGATAATDASEVVATVEPEVADAPAVSAEAEAEPVSDVEEPIALTEEPEQAATADADETEAMDAPVENAADYLPQSVESAEEDAGLDDKVVEGLERLVDASQPVASEAPLVEDVVEEAVEEKSEAEAAAETPAPVAEEQPAAEADADANEPVVEEVAERENGKVALRPTKPVLLAHLAGTPLVSKQNATANDKKMSRKERRRRERAEKKKSKTRKDAAAATDLPEIILARSEGTDTLIPETAEKDVPVVHDNVEEPAVTEEPVAEAVSEEATRAEASEDVSEPVEDAAPIADAVEQVAEETMETANEEASAAVAEDGEQPGASLDGNALPALPAPTESVAMADDSEGESAMLLPALHDGASTRIDDGEADAADGAEVLADAETEGGGANAVAEAPENATDAADGDFDASRSGDHLMIIATGGLDLRDDAYSLLSDGDEDFVDDYEPEGRDGAGNNVILFRNHFPVLDDDGTEEEAEDATPGVFLRMLPPVAETDEEEAASEPAAEAEEAAGTEAVAETGETPESEAEADSPAAMAEEAPEGLSLMSRIGLLRALSGAPEIAGGDDAVETAGADHVILAQDVDPAAEAEEAARVEEAARAEIEREYQERLDEFARRVLEAQALVSEGESRVREKQREVEARDAELAELRLRLALGEERLAASRSETEQARRETADRDAELASFSELRDEHQRLYDEFEDLRTAYNEVVTDVMPELQGERDDLVLTVERQCAEGDAMRGALRSSRKRLAVGYAMGAAAVLTMLVLPVANWMKAGDDTRDLAMGHQQASELRERVERAEKRNVETEQVIFDLQRKVNLAQTELEQAQKKNVELARIAEQQLRELGSGRAPASARSGTPTRTSTMALQAVPRGNSQLQRNEVRDTDGRIEQTALENRSVREREESRGGQLARRSGASIPVSAVSSTALRPPSGSAQERPGRVAANAAPVQTASRRGGNDVTAKVKAGEGVAQVVYRVLGTRDPEVIAWVIRENGIKTDRRGNPRIYPDQELKLPQGGRTGQSASAAGR